MFFYDTFWTGAAKKRAQSWPTLPVCLTKPRRVQLVQQKMCYYVESVFIGFVEHVPDNQNNGAEISVRIFNLRVEPQL